MPATKPRKQPAVPEATPARPADRDRDRRALDYAARRVPVWQVSAVTALLRLSEQSGVEWADRLKLVLAQVPPPVLRAAKLHRQGKWKPL